jgi:membrane protein implicated in regulation of membrane protease activity
MVWLWVWGIVTALALVIEFITSDLITVWFAAGGLVTLLVVSLANGLAVIWQLVIFVGVSVVLLLCTRKICLKLLRNDDARTNVDALVGKKFVVEDINNGYTYQKFNGVLWSVYPVDGEVLENDVEFEICEIKGNKLIAKRVKK